MGMNEVYPRREPRNAKEKQRLDSGITQNV